MNPFDERIAAASQAERESSNEACLRVWLVDDNRRLRELMAELLTAEGGLDCTRQFPSAEAVLGALSTETAPDVILLDNQMGGMTGVQALRPIRYAAGDTRVVMLTSCRDPFTRAQAYRNGAADFLPKTATPGEIAERIRRARALPMPEATVTDGEDAVRSNTLETEFGNSRAGGYRDGITRGGLDLSDDRNRPRSSRLHRGLNRLLAVLGRHSLDFKS